MGGLGGVHGFIYIQQLFFSPSLTACSHFVRNTAKQRANTDEVGAEYV